MALLKINFKVEVNRWTNFYFFLQNLSEWNDHFRKEYNETWIRELEIPATLLAELKMFARIHRRYARPARHLARPFLNGKNPFIALRRMVTQKECHEVNLAFRKFAPFFDRLWKVEEVRLRNWSRRLTSGLTQSRKRSVFESTLSKLYAPKASSAKILVTLVCSAGNTLGGQVQDVGDGKKRVIVEISRAGDDRANFAEGIVWHETIHAAFDGATLKPALKKMKMERMSIHEIAAGLLFPRGVLGQEYLGISPPKNGFIRSYPQANEELLALMRDRVSSERVLDRTFVEEVVRLYKKAP